MIRNLLLTAVRSLKKNKFFSLLNVIGLSIGMSVFLFIAQYVRFEKSFEDFIPDADEIYRVTLTTYFNNELVQSSAENYPAVGPALKSELPEVISYARLYNLGYKNNVVITNEDAPTGPIAFKHRRFLYADSSFLPMMKYPMKGNANTALAEPFTAVISEKYARMYFGNEDPTGKMLRMQDDDFNNELVKVTGVFRDLPDNTHLNFDILFSYKTLFARNERAVERYEQSWQRKDMYTFIKVIPGTVKETLEAKFPDIVSKYNPALAEKNQKDIIGLQPLKDIHLTSNLAEEVETNGDERIVLFLGLIGVFVLVIAWINYINLSTAKAMERAKEVGVRKVMGAFKFQLIRQFVMESAIINLLAILIAYLMVLLMLPYFNSIAGLSLLYTYFLEPVFLLAMLALWMMGTLFSGFYPALVLSSFKPVVVLKGKLQNSLGGILLRRTLVVLQFTASIALIAGTIIVYRQLNFMMKQDLGMNINQVLVAERPGIAARDRNAFNSSIDVFRNELQKDPNIEGVTLCGTVPGKLREYKVPIKKYGASDDEHVTVRVNEMDYNFIDVFKMHLIAGRNFSEQYTSDADTSVIITESASKLLGFKTPEEAIGQTISVSAFNWHPIVVGVVNDYHQVSLKKALDPTIFYFSLYYGEYYSIRLNTNDLDQAVERIKVSWAKAFPGNPFEYFFLDDYFNQQYENEQKFGKLFTTFSALALVVGCLGLFGLSAYTATQRTKEIGIRKVLGSSELAIFVLLSREYLKLVCIAIVIAVPLVWWVMENWIERFPYRASISISIFIVSGLAVLLVSLSTVSFQTLKAARTNPVDSLRYE